MIHVTPAPGRGPLDVYYATDCRITAGPGGLRVATTIAIPDARDAGALLLARLRWAAFVRHVSPVHTASVAALASRPNPH